MQKVSTQKGRWSETVLLVAIGSLLIFGMAQPAFDAYFLGENFIYVSQYYAHDHNFWRAIFSPVLGIFFRPVLVALSILSDFVVPLDPWPYHFRNFAFCTLNLLLLHRVLLRLVTSYQARAFALGLFALSKIHLTTIGYINTFDEIVLLTLTLLTMLFLIRYVDRQRLLDYGLTLLFFLLTIFSKDYGLAVIGPCWRWSSKGKSAQEIRAFGAIGRGNGSGDLLQWQQSQRCTWACVSRSPVRRPLIMQSILRDSRWRSSCAS